MGSWCFRVHQRCGGARRSISWRAVPTCGIGSGWLGRPTAWGTNALHAAPQGQSGARVVDAHGRDDTRRGCTYGDSLSSESSRRSHRRSGFPAYGAMSLRGLQQTGIPLLDLAPKYAPYPMPLMLHRPHSPDALQAIACSLWPGCAGSSSNTWFPGTHRTLSPTSRRFHDFRRSAVPQSRPRRHARASRHGDSGHKIQSIFDRYKIVKRGRPRRRDGAPHAYVERARREAPRVHPLEARAQMHALEQK